MILMYNTKTRQYWRPMDIRIPVDGDVIYNRFRQQLVVIDDKAPKPAQPVTIWVPVSVEKLKEMKCR